MTRTIMKLVTLCSSALLVVACQGEPERRQPMTARDTPEQTEPAPPVQEPRMTPPAEDMPGAVTTVELPTDPEQKLQLAITIANEVDANPEQSEQILARHRLDREKLDALMFDIAADPQLRERYRQARAGQRPGQG